MITLRDRIVQAYKPPFIWYNEPGFRTFVYSTCGKVIAEQGQEKPFSIEALSFLNLSHCILRIPLYREVRKILEESGASKATSLAQAAECLTEFWSKYALTP